MRLTAAVVASALVLLGSSPPVGADEDQGSIVVDGAGNRWVSMSVADVVAHPVVRALEARIRSRMEGRFRLTTAVGTDADPEPGRTMVHDRGVTRLVERSARTRTITYIGPGRECRRTVGRGASVSIESDRSASFRCHARRSTTIDGVEAVTELLPTSVVRGAHAAQQVVLVPESMALEGQEGASTLSLAIKDAGVLQSVGLQAGPGLFATYVVSPADITVRVDESNGTSWRISEASLSTAGVPRLPARIRNLAR